MDRGKSMMNYFRSILPRYPVDSDDLAILRERILQIMMAATSILGSVLYIVLVQNALKRSAWADVFFFSLMILFVWSITLFQKFPYPLRSGGILLIIFVITVYSLAQSGLSGHARVFLLIFWIMSAALLGAKALGVSLILGFTTLLFFGIGMTNGWLPIPPLGSNGDSSNQRDWLLTGLFLIVAIALTAIPVLVILTKLQKSLHDKSDLFIRLEAERSGLEARITARTFDLERRLTQIRTAAEIARSMSSVLDPDELLQHIVNLLAERAQLYYVGVFLIDASGAYAVLRAGSGAAGKAMISEGHRLQIGGSSMVGWTTATRQARIALDVGEDAVRFNNPHLPLTRSELALPIVGKTMILGALTVQSEKPDAFDKDDILILQGIADSLAIAIENAHFFQQNQRDLEEIRTLNQQYLEHAWAEANVSGDLKYSYHNPYNSSECGIQSLQVPLVVREQPIGKITLDTGGKELSAEEIAVVEAITNQTALALESARLLEQTTRRAERERKVLDITSKIRSTNDFNSMVQVAVEELQLALGASRAQVIFHSATEGIISGKNDKERRDNP
jgi:GAF domain-containing protein